MSTAPPRTAGALLLLLASCTAQPQERGGGSEPAIPVTASQLPGGTMTEAPSGLDSALLGTLLDGLPRPTVPLSELRAGGPPPDGIPPIDSPRFLPADRVDFLSDNEPVLALEVNGEARAYPVQVLIWHEIVNDTVGGLPVAVTYCPLCNSAVAYDRRVAGEVVTFGTSGLLWNSSLVMYDRQTETLWSHFTGAGIVGVHTGVELTTYPVATVSWAEWRARYPDGLVLSRATGFDRDYGENPYPGYDDIGTSPFLFEGEVDGRYPAITRIVGVSDRGRYAAVPLPELQTHGVVSFDLDGIEVVVFWQPGASSALDAKRIADGADVGATGAFIAALDGRPLTFTRTDDGFVDTETGSSWDIFGTARSGSLVGSQLTRVVHLDTFWFAWAAFRPDSLVIDGEA